MSFAEHLKGVLKNNISSIESCDNFSKNISDNSANLDIYPKLKSANQAQQNEYVSDFQINEYDLALHQPVRFIRKYANANTISNAIAKNPNISRILKTKNLKVKFNIENINSLILSHLIPTSKTAQKMYKAIGHNPLEVEYLYLTQAALLHDIGKVFIPNEILDKKGKLTNEEREIIELHNSLSYEILHTTDLNPKVCKLTLEHHNYENNVKRSPENQILMISDIFCALKEKRPYKKPINEICAKAILYDMGTKGAFDTSYINYLNN